MDETKNIDTSDREAAGQVASRWAFINQWQVAEQSTDRMPVTGAVPNRSGPAALRRSVARRAHQVEYKEWSKQRHD
jgi:hypothetical protein